MTGPSLPAVAAGVHLVGAVGVTAVVNVPMNDALAARTLDWATYRRRWTGWNHVRTVAATLATVIRTWGSAPTTG